MFHRQFSRNHSFQSLGYGRKTSQRPFQSFGRALMNTSDLPPPRQTIGERIRKKLRRAGGFLLFATVYGAILSSIPSWEQSLDVICRIVPPKTVPRTASSLTSTPNIIYDPIHQDPPTRQQITRPNEFRILILEPGLGTEEVRCRLVNVTNSWRTRYEALSYAWGDETLRENVIVDGLRTSITKNLYSALVHLRDPVRPRTLWVDALCVNQDDLEERDEQVKIMGFIYSTARNVVIWLGEETQEVQEAFPILQEKNKSAIVDWSPVLNLLRRPWFQRTWIIQEAVLGRGAVLACGHKTMPWELFSDCCSSDEFQGLLPDNDPEVAQALRAVEMIAHGRYEHHTTHIVMGHRRGKRPPIKEKYTPDFGLVTTLYETRGFKCKDERDKVFAVLSMVTNIGPEDEVLRPNYRATMEDVLETVAKWDIQKNKSLELLSYCSRKAWTHSNLPSWVPDFSDIDEAHSISFLLRMRETKRTRHIQRKQFKSNLGFIRENQPQFLKENDKTVLVLSGRVVDTIAKVGAVADNSKIVDYTTTKEGDKGLARLNMTAVSKRREWFYECVRIALAADPASSNEPENIAAFWKSPKLGMSPYQFECFPRAMMLGRPSDYGNILSYAKFLFETVDVNPHWYQFWKGKEYRNRHSCERVDKCFRKFVNKRRFCATKTGRLGWVPGAAMEGDLVCEVSGAQVPIILRKAQAIGRYIVVGDAYIDGIMQNDNQTVYVGGERLALV